MGIYILPIREQALANYYAAERRAGACPILATERMGEFAKRLDDLEYIPQEEPPRSLPVTPMDMLNRAVRPAPTSIWSKS
jgi:hypothetical protein